MQEPLRIICVEHSRAERGIAAEVLADSHLEFGWKCVSSPSALSGVTAEFNRNVLTRIQRELGADFRPRLFRHRVLWNDREARIEMHLESLVSQEVAIPSLELTVGFRRGETIHTENSYKFTPETAGKLMGRSGFAVRRNWMDSRGWFGVYLAEAE